jgi:hypothetical protein
VSEPGPKGQLPHTPPGACLGHKLPTRREVHERTPSAIKASPSACGIARGRASGCQKRELRLTVLRGGVTHRSGRSSNGEKKVFERVSDPIEGSRPNSRLTEVRPPLLPYLMHRHLEDQLHRSPDRPRRRHTAGTVDRFRAFINSRTPLEGSGHLSGDGRLWRRHANSLDLRSPVDGGPACRAGVRIRWARGRGAW